MKIVALGTRGIPRIMGGVETHCEELYPRLVAKGYDITLIRRSAYCTEDVGTQYKGVKLHDMKAPRIKSLEAIIHTFHAVLAARFVLHADVVHIHAIGPALLTPLARLLGMKVVVTHHGEDYMRKKWGKFARFVLRTGEIVGSLTANEMIVISSVIANSLRQKHLRKRTHLIHNGVPQPERTSHTTYLESIGVEAGNYIFTLGRFVPEKNFHQLIEAFAPLKERGVKLVIAGDADFDDSYSLQLKAMAKEHGVVLTGFIKGEPLHELFSHARLFVLPSAHEGLPISLLEAMSYQRPVLVSDIKPNLAVELDPECYFELHNIPALTQKIEKNLTSPYQPITYNMDSYNWDTIATQVAHLYDTMR